MMPNTKQQNQWIKQLKKGNELAAFNLYESYSKAMYNTLVRISGQNEVAEDLLQEAFITAFSRIDELQNAAAFGGWLKSIVINAGLTYIRRNRYQFEALESLDQFSEEEMEESHIDPTLLHQAIRELPDGCRAVLSLHAFEGLKHSEIAKHLKISASTSKTQFRHAKLLLKKKLKEYYED